jgi:hypothetical protein
LTLGHVDGTLDAGVPRPPWRLPALKACQSNMTRVSTADVTHRITGAPLAK